MWQKVIGEFSNKRDATILRYMIVYITVAMVVLTVFLVGIAQGRSAETRVPDNEGKEYDPPFNDSDGPEIQQLGMTPRPRYVYEYFGNFVLPVYNETGKCRVLLCDIVLELNDGITVSGERQRVRKLLFRTSQSLSYGVADIRSMKKQLCERIKNAVNEAVDKAAVKDVQITRFLLL